VFCSWPCATKSIYCSWSPKPITCRSVLCVIKSSSFASEYIYQLFYISVLICGCKNSFMSGRLVFKFLHVGRNLKAVTKVADTFLSHGVWRCEMLVCHFASCWVVAVKFVFFMATEQFLWRMCACMSDDMVIMRVISCHKYLIYGDTLGFWRMLWACMSDGMAIMRLIAL
jgi:hypothetical protein